MRWLWLLALLCSVPGLYGLIQDKEFSVARRQSRPPTGANSPPYQRPIRAGAGELDGTEGDVDVKIREGAGESDATDSDEDFGFRGGHRASGSDGDDGYKSSRFHTPSNAQDKIIKLLYETFDVQGLNFQRYNLLASPPPSPPTPTRRPSTLERLAEKSRSKDRLNRLGDRSESPEA